MSILDMNSRMAMAEKLSVPQLQEAIQSGSLPAYIGIPLIEQKNKEKSQMQAAQGGQQEPPSVTSRVLQEAQQQPPQEQGITQLPSNLPTMGPEQGMADGGIVAFAEAGQVQAPQEPIPLSTYGNMPLMSPEAQARFAKQEQRLEELSGRNESAYSDAKNMAIFQAGIGMMGGQSSNPFANATAGIMPALTGYQAAVKDLKKEERDALTKLMELGLSKDKFIQEAQKIGVEADKANKAFESARLSDAARIAAAEAANKNKQTRAETDVEYKERLRKAEQKRLEDGGMPEPDAFRQSAIHVANLVQKDPTNQSEFVDDYVKAARDEGNTTDSDATLRRNAVIELQGIIASGKRAQFKANVDLVNLRTKAVQDDSAVKAAQQKLTIAEFKKDLTAIETLKTELKKAKEDAGAAWDAGLAKLNTGAGAGGAGNTRTGSKEDPFGLFIK